MNALRWMALVVFVSLGSVYFAAVGGKTGLDAGLSDRPAEAGADLDRAFDLRTTFKGLNESITDHPLIGAPDPSIAAGPASILLTTNDLVLIRDKSGGW